MELSEADNWEDAALEWKLVGVSYVKEGGYCICGHFIKEFCFIRNVVNGSRTIVGNHCIKKFKGQDLTNVFRALAQNKINPALLGHAIDEDIITKWEFNFMMDVWRKRKLSYKQGGIFDAIKAKIYKACQMETKI